MKSIRASLILGSVLGTIAVFSLSGVAVYRGAKATLVHELDRSLEGQAHVMASVVKQTPDGMEVEIADIDLPEFTSSTGRGYLELWLDADSVLYRSPRLGGDDLKATISSELNRSTLQWIRTGDGVYVRAVSFRTEAVVDPEDWEEVHRPAPKPRIVQVVVAEETTRIDAFLARLRGLLVAVGALGGLAVAFVLAMVVRRSLRPLDDLAGEIGKLSDSDLSARVRVPVIPREVEPVVEQLNQLLERLDAAFLRERTFSSDIAHELRTPLAGLRSTIEVTMSRPRSEGDYREVLDALLGIVRKVQTMVETLLYLGRLDAGQVEIESRAVDLCAQLKATWETIEDRARARNLAVEWNLPAEANITADPILLEVAVRNVLANAVAYADEAGTIRIEVVAADGAYVLRVANTGSRIAQERIGDLMRRFTRADPARRASGDHFGLGLALTSKIVAALRGGMEIESSVGGEFVVSFRFQGV